MWPMRLQIITEVWPKETHTIQTYKEGYPIEVTSKVPFPFDFDFDKVK